MSDSNPAAKPENGSLATDDDTEAQYRRPLWILAAATFVIFFQGFMVAPLIPLFSELFEADEQFVGLVMPAYMIPYGFATLAFGLMSDRLGRQRLMIGSMLALVVLSAGTATAQTAEQLIAWRIAAGLGAAAVVPLSLTLIGDLFPFERSGKPLGLIFAALAGGIAAGKTLGVLMVPAIGWQGLFLLMAGASGVVLVLMVRAREVLGTKPEKPGGGLRGMMSGFRALLSSARGRSTYGYVFLNSVFHGGVYTWLGVYFADRYGLGELGIGLAIIGYGIPGFLFSRPIGKAADRWGRRWILPAGLAVGAVSVIGLVPLAGVVIAAVVVMILSIGFALTQPLFAGIVTDLGGKERGGQAMGLNVFLLFNGFGLGAFLFGELLRVDFATALIIFAVGEIVLAAGAVWLFRGETPKVAGKDAESLDVS